MKLWTSAAVLLSGCAASLPVPPPANVQVSFDAASVNASDALLVQMRSLNAFALPLGLRRLVVVDPMLDASTGQQTSAAQQLERRVTERLTSGLVGIELRPMAGATVSEAPYLLTGTLTHALVGLPKGSLMLNLALTDLQSSIVVAQAWALTSEAGVNEMPIRCDVDTPAVLKERIVEGYIRTSATGAGRPADAFYLKHLSVPTTVVCEASEL